MPADLRLDRPFRLGLARVLCILRNSAGSVVRKEGEFIGPNVGRGTTAFQLEPEEGNIFSLDLKCVYYRNLRKGHYSGPAVRALGFGRIEATAF